MRGCRVDVGLRDGEGCQRAAAVFDVLAVDGHQHFDAGFVHQAANVCGQDDGRTAGGDGGNDALPFQFAQCFARAVGHGAAFFRPQGVVDVEEDDFGRAGHGFFGIGDRLKGVRAAWGCGFVVRQGTRASPWGGTPCLNIGGRPCLYVRAGCR